MSERLRIVVTGLAGTYPFGGVFWDYLQYPLGFHGLGHDVLYLEDTGKWCYDPVAHTFVEDGERNAAHLARNLAALEPALADRWFLRDCTGRTFGWDWERVARFCGTADLFLHVSASCWMRDEYFAAGTVAFIDSDPMYTQSSVPAYLAGTADPLARSRIDELRRHHVFFTFGENVGAPDCGIPTELFDWIPTRQPVVLDRFHAARVPPRERRQVLTTVASWEPAESGPIVRDVQYRGKSVEFLRFADLPSRSPLPLEIAMSGPAPERELLPRGWILRDGAAVSRDPWTYRDYLAGSLAEWSVAKNAYVAPRTGWFSCRTACYLALGVPAVVQDTGFGCAVPSGAGVLGFTTLDEAAAGIEAVVAQPERHSAVALDIAREYFDSNRVLTQLLERALARRPARGSRS